MNAISAKFQAGTAALAVAAAASLTPVIAQADSFALDTQLASPAQVLTWGSDDLDPTLLAQLNDAKAAAPAGAAVTAGPIQTLLQYLVQGIATGVRGIVRGTVVIVGTTAYVGLAFTGGVITAVGNILPGPIGNIITNVGQATTNVANALAEAIHVGPYGTVA